MSTTLGKPITPTAREVQLAKESSRCLARFLNRDLRLSIAETGETVELPAAAVGLLVNLLSAMAEGSTVTLIPIHDELTTQQAADLLGVSRPFLIKQLEQGRIPFRKVGTHRRIRFQDLMQYKKEIDQKRLEALNELTAQAQELRLGY